MANPRTEERATQVSEVLPDTKASQAQETQSAQVAVLMEQMNKQAQEIAALREAVVNSGRKTAKIIADDPHSVIVREDTPESGGGWVIKTPLPWNGVRSGVRFMSGYGIVDVSLKRSTELAHLFEHDYGYEVVAVNAQQLNEVRRMREQVNAEQPMGLHEKLINTGNVR